MKKIDRLAVYGKCNGHCGYCGREISMKDMQVDHMKPKCLGGGNDPDNLMPTCKKCNHYKRALTIEGFRVHMRDLHKRVSAIYICQVAVNFGMATITPFDGTFYFEKCDKNMT